MASPIPNAVRQPDHEHSYDKCLVHGVDEIRGYLQRLVDARCVIVGHADGEAAPQVTALLRVDATSLLVDVPRSKDALRAWLDSPKLRFEGSLERITVRFATGPAWFDRHDGFPALGLALPTRLLYRQRREFLRIEPPIGTLQCRLPLHDPAGEPGWLDATIRDIGGGGLAVLAPSRAQTFEIGDILTGCVIDLPEGDRVTVNLLVRHLIERAGRGQCTVQAGCEFVDLPPGAQDKLFRYVMKLDRERVSRLRALD